MKRNLSLTALCLTLGTVSLHFGCSSDPDDDNGSLGGAAGESSSGGSDNGGSGGGGASNGGAGGEDSGPPDIDCTTTKTLMSGSNYGDYSLFAIRVDLELSPGEYSVRTNNRGTAYVYREDTLLEEFSFDPTLSLEDGTEQTVAFPNFFELDLRSQAAADLSDLGSTLFDGCHLVTVTAAEGIMEDGTYGPYVLEELTVDGSAPAGTYTLYAEAGNAGSVELRLDGEVVDTLTYPWQTIIGGGDSFTFEFPDLVTFTVTRAMGTSNLFGLADSLFDGRQEFTVK